MAIIYPKTSAGAAPVSNAVSDIGARYKYYTSTIDPNGNPMQVGTPYTASIQPSSSVTSFLVFTTDNNGANSIPLQLPTSSLIGYDNNVQILPSIEFFRVDDNDCEIKLVTQNNQFNFGNVSFFGGSSYNQLILPPLSYTSITQIELGGGFYIYQILQQSRLNTGPRTDRYLNTGSIYTFGTNDEKILLNEYSGSTIILPDASNWSRRLENKIVIKAVGTGSCTISGSVYDTIDESLTYNLVSGSSVSIEWFLTGSNYRWVTI